jgi:chromosome segregation ATPase
MLTTILLLSLLLIAVVILALLFLRLRKLDSEHRALSQEHSDLKIRIKDITDVDAERERVLAEIENIKRREAEEVEDRKRRAAQEIEDLRGQGLAGIEAERARLQGEVARLGTEQMQAIQSLQEQRRLGESEIVAICSRAEEAQNQAIQSFREQQTAMQEQQKRATAEMEALQLNINRLRVELKPLDEEATLQSFGFYKPHYNFSSSGQYQVMLDEVREGQKQMIKYKTAAVCHTEWTIDGDRAAGRKQTNQTLRLILRAFNGECDAAIAKVKYNNIQVMEARIRKAWEAINSLEPIPKLLSDRVATRKQSESAPHNSYRSSPIVPTSGGGG